MLIPHSEKKVFNIQVSLFSIVSFCTVFVALAVSFFYFSSSYTGSQRVLEDRNVQIEEVEANLNTFQEEIGSVVQSAQVFEKVLNQTLTTLTGQTSGDYDPEATGSDLSQFFRVKESVDGELGGIKHLRIIQETFDNSVGPLEDLRKYMAAQERIKSDIPSILPLKGVKGRITLQFGPAENPFTGQWYLHQGLDIAHGWGIPIVASANGTVVKVEHQLRGYGNYVLIRHKWGFYTRYAHLQTTMVNHGDAIKQGDVIGTMGNTGNSTGPHLHYEVKMGSNLLDPATYIGMTYDVYGKKKKL